MAGVGEVDFEIKPDLFSQLTAKPYSPLNISSSLLVKYLTQTQCRPEERETTGLVYSQTDSDQTSGDEERGERTPPSLSKRPGDYEQFSLTLLFYEWLSGSRQEN